MICGVKYCGGCNSRYHRTKFFDHVKEACGNVDFQYGPAGHRIRSSSGDLRMSVPVRGYILDHGQRKNI